MPELVLALGSANYSSWSLRGWLALTLSGLPFAVERLPAGTPAFAGAIAAWAPARLVPALRIDGRVVWDSLAIAETVAELAAAAPLWPSDAAARAAARGLCAEMHAGFAALREHMPMNIRARKPGKGQGPGVAEDIARIVDLWAHARDGFGAGGDFLFGAWSLADVFYAPVVLRFLTYEVALPDFAAAYRDAVAARPDVAAWCAEARAETLVLPQYEL